MWVVTNCLILFLSVLFFSSAIYMLTLNKFPKAKNKLLWIVDVSATVMATSSGILILNYMVEVI